MKMESLKKLHQSMRVLGVDMQKFQVRLGAAEFDCLFSTRDDPFVLALTSRGLNPRFFRFVVNRGYWIRDYLGDLYGPLVEVLKIDGSSGKRLVPKDFLVQLDAAIPHAATQLWVPEPHVIVQLRADLEEAGRPYFDTWIYWDSESNRSPRKENMVKTLEALGPEALEYSKRMNASSKWSMTPTSRTWKSERRST
ncbi:hypothetical protein HOP51_13300 [Halomonas sp. MCCC 1A11036]|uniref:Uncharacterized protein n=1 Tax=Billgrantia zhangzhouensis TaxID=2733481 RepID=A0ABS9AH42_9GAMM|nr:DUF6037 family protein [Halomonas zhangzhouensis]MCE8021078.1 hypothetical protein [Halomonas zhangzhouensis]